MKISHIAEYYRRLVKQYESACDWDAFDRAFEKYLGYIGVLTEE